MKTQVINLKHARPGDVYIGRAGKGRPGPWGNPFRLQNTKDDTQRQAVLDRYPPLADCRGGKRPPAAHAPGGPGGKEAQLFLQAQGLPRRRARASRRVGRQRPGQGGQGRLESVSRTNQACARPRTLHSFHKYHRHTLNHLMHHPPPRQPCHQDNHRLPPSRSPSRQGFPT